MQKRFCGLDSMVSLRRKYMCRTFEHMKKALTVRLDRDLERTLDQFCRRSKRKRSEVVRDALRRQLSLMTFEQLRHKAMPFAEARGFLTDEDVAKAVLRSTNGRDGTSSCVKQVERTASQQALAKAEAAAGAQPPCLRSRGRVCMIRASKA